MRETAIDRNQVKRVVRVNSHLKLLIFWCWSGVIRQIQLRTEATDEKGKIGNAPNHAS